ncbi:hypothetical protein A7U60_g8364 [Sanghuangporus baumii]|uniref:Beta-glucuronidase C-terminal domain-containing protein n=1 Tax=Sanghuangporus baumii TaxID=108892 RepID=A0A9Q5HR32_SANBA|nr:hypothetical protein A7U60_g8364 [Sanghuangporus baumii]
MKRFFCFILMLHGLRTIRGAPTNVSLPSFLSGSNASLVRSNFFGISIELSVVNTISDVFFLNDFALVLLIPPTVGENTSSIPTQMENYLGYIQNRTQSPVRIRVGGNSMDDSIFNSTQSKMIVYTGEAVSAHDQPVSYGPILYDVLANLAKNIGGAEYLIGLSLLLREENNTPLTVSTAQQKLAGYLGAFLLGNEPDLYGAHARRQSNYSVQDYFGEFTVVVQQLNNSNQYGDLLPRAYLGGPTICFVSLAKWQKDGIGSAKAADKPVLMGEFNTASCGGFPGISDTFAATLWAIDYVLQLASVGYDGAYIHTRERGITYNLFDPPASNDSSSNWTTLPTYYALLPVAEALSPGWQNGSLVMDFGLNNNSESSLLAGYGIYDGQTSALSTMIFLNYADVGQDGAMFSLPSLGKNTMFTRTLTAASLSEKYNISWAGQTFLGVGDGKMVQSGFAQDQQVSCDDTCDFVVPSPGAVVVWLDTSAASSSPTTSHGFSWRHAPSEVFMHLSFISGGYLLQT